MSLLPPIAGSGGPRVQERNIDQARAILADAEAVAGGGAFAMVVEAVPSELRAIITERVPIPTTGIGAGCRCGGQVLISTDVLGQEDRQSPRFVKRDAEVGRSIRDTFATHVAEVRGGMFPDEAYSYTMKAETEALRRSLADG